MARELEEVEKHLYKTIDKLTTQIVRLMQRVDDLEMHIALEVMEKQLQVNQEV